MFCVIYNSIKIITQKLVPNVVHTCEKFHIQHSLWAVEFDQSNATFLEYQLRSDYSLFLDIFFQFADVGELKRILKTQSGIHHHFYHLHDNFLRKPVLSVDLNSYIFLCKAYIYYKVIKIGPSSRTRSIIHICLLMSSINVSRTIIFNKIEHVVSSLHPHDFSSYPQQLHRLIPHQG